MRVLVVLLLAVLPQSSALAEDCASAASQAAMTQCADQEFRKADAALNTAYKEIRERLKDDADKTKRLVAAQKAWLAFRDAECGFATSASMEGSVYPMLVASCRADLTSRRVDQLKSYLDCAEGDLACPVPGQ